MSGQTLYERDFHAVHNNIVRLMDDYYSTPTDDFKKRYAYQQFFRKKYSFTILTSYAVYTIKKYSPLVEVGCGGGYLSWELRRFGIDIIATDPKNQWKQTTWLNDIKKISGVEAIKKFSDRNVLMSWPYFKGSWFLNTIKEMKSQYLIYCGEGYGGCCGTNNFFHHIMNNFKEVKTIEIPSFAYIHDNIVVYENNK